MVSGTWNRIDDVLALIVTARGALYTFHAPVVNTQIMHE